MLKSKVFKIVSGYVLLKVMISAVLLLLSFFSPSQSLMNCSVIYGFIYLGSTLLFLFTTIAFAIFKKSGRKNAIGISTVLAIGLFIFLGCFYVWENYTTNQIVIRIINNTGHHVTDAGIYGCFEEKWGTMRQGESKTVRFPINTTCAFMVTCNDKRNIKLEMLPRKYFETNIYYLGTNYDNEENR